MPGEATSKYHRPWPPAEEVAKPAPAPSAPPYDAAELRAALRSRGMRVTPQRLAVHNALHDLGRHSTAEEVLERVHGTVPGVSLPTVYAALELLTDLGLALRVHAGRAVRFDPRSAAAPPPRLHRHAARWRTSTPTSSSAPPSSGRGRWAPRRAAPRWSCAASAPTAPA